MEFREEQEAFPSATWERGHRGQIGRMGLRLREFFSAERETGDQPRGQHHAVAEIIHDLSGQIQADRYGGDGKLQFLAEVIELIPAGKDVSHLLPVTSKDVAEALAAKNYTIDRRKIVLDDPIRQLGEYKIQVKLHHEVSAEITVVVAKEE